MMLATVKVAARKLVGRQLRKHFDFDLYRRLRAAGAAPWTSLAIVRSGHVRSTMLHRHGPQLIARAIPAMEAVGMRPFIMWGSLLGYRRDGGFIAHDYDVDLAIFAHELAKLDALKVTLATEGLIVREKSEFAFNIEHKDLPDLWIDVWVQYEIDGNYVVCMCDHRHHKGFYVYRLPVELFREFQEVEFEGCRVRAPKEMDRILDLSYGNWRTPNPDHYENNCPCATLELHPPRVNAGPLTGRMEKHAKTGSTA